MSYFGLCRRNTIRLEVNFDKVQTKATQTGSQHLEASLLLFVCFVLVVLVAAAAAAAAAAVVWGWGGVGGGGHGRSSERGGGGTTDVKSKMSKMVVLFDST